MFGLGAIVSTSPEGRVANRRGSSNKIVSSPRDGILVLHFIFIDGKLPLPIVGGVQSLPNFTPRRVFGFDAVTIYGL